MIPSDYRKLVVGHKGGDDRTEEFYTGRDQVKPTSFEPIWVAFENLRHPVDLTHLYFKRDDGHGPV